MLAAPHRLPALVASLCFLLTGGAFDLAVDGPPTWTNGPPTDPSYFPIAVWLQDPRNAPRFKAAGINLYVGLWRGPTPSQLDTLEQAGMPVICAQTPTGLAHRHRSIIVGWMHDDEPDNAQSLGEGRGYGPPLSPTRIQADYERLRAADPTRPVLLNLGQGVAYDNYIGRGVRRNRPEDYPEYLKGCDIASFDIYPVVHENPEVAGKLEFVARGVSRLREWTRGEKTVWNCIECTHIGNPKAKATPDQIRSEVWMALIHGSRGLIYFVHQFQPTFKEAALLDDPEALAAVTALNQRIRDLAPVLNRPTLTNRVTVAASEPDVPIGAMMKQLRATNYLFTVNLRPRPTRATFTFPHPSTLPDVAAGTPITVLDESRTLTLDQAAFTDHFEPYQVHLYRWPAPHNSATP